MNFCQFWFIMVLSVLSAVAFQMPSYMKKCKFEDMTECVLENIPYMRPHFKTGIKEFGIPPLCPFHIAEVILEGTPNLTIKITNLDIFHIDEFVVKHVSIDSHTYRAEWNLHFDKIHLVGTYEVNGNLILPIKGNGPGDILLEQFDVDFVFSFKPIEIDNKLYANISNQTFDFRTERMFIKLENLFDGDKKLGDEMNKFLNDNWRDVADILHPAIANTVNTIINNIVDQVAKSAPIDEYFIV